MLRFGLGLWFCCLGCASPTAVRLVLSAEPEVASATESVRISVYRQDGTEEVRDAVRGSIPEAEYPFGLPIEPIDGDASREFLVVARALADDGSVLAEQRAQAGFTESEERFLPLTFTRTCGETACAALETCRSGRCESACVEAAPSAESSLAESDCWTKEVGPLRQGCDLTFAIRGESGEARAEWPACAELETTAPVDCINESTAGSVELVALPTESGGAHACGGERAFVATLDGSATNRSALTLPASGPRERLFLRAFLFVPEATATAVSQNMPRNTALLSIGVGANLRSPGARINLRFNSFLEYNAGSGSVTGQLTQLIPEARWSCLELGFDVAAAEIFSAIDGVPQPPLAIDSELDAAIRTATTFSGNAGLIATPASTISVRFDHVAISSARLPCPTR